jgi:hypothetical protein
MTADEIHELEQRMDALAREYGATHDPKVLAELEELARRLRELEEKRNGVIQRILH